MRPRFSTITRVLSVVFLLAGMGAGWAALAAGNQVTPGHGDDRVILVVLAVGYLVVGVGLWAELVWAWWAGVSIAAVTVVLSLVSHAPDAGWALWLVFLVLFAVTGVQGFREERPPR